MTIPSEDPAHAGRAACRASGRPRSPIGVETGASAIGEGVLLGEGDTDSMEGGWSLAAGVGEGVWAGVDVGEGVRVGVGDGEGLGVEVEEGEAAGGWEAGAVGEAV